MKCLHVVKLDFFVFRCCQLYSEKFTLLLLGAVNESKRQKNPVLGWKQRGSFGRPY